MQLNWVKKSTDVVPDGVRGNNKSYVLHLASCQSAAESAIKQAIIATAHKAAELLVDNIDDDSLYLLFIWQTENATLSAVVTDDKKSNDASHVARCTFPNAPTDGYADSEPLSEVVSFWIRDYLTTSSDYMRFSLVSIYTDSTRDQTSML